MAYESGSTQSSGPAYPEFAPQAAAQTGEMVASAKAAKDAQLGRLQDLVSQLQMAQLLARLMAKSQAQKSGGMANPAAISRSITDLMNQAGVPFDTAIQQAIQSSSSIENTLNSLMTQASQVYTQLAAIPKSQSSSFAGEGISIGGAGQTTGRGRGTTTYPQSGQGGTFTGIRGGGESPFAGGAKTFAGMTEPQSQPGGFLNQQPFQPQQTQQTQIASGGVPANLIADAIFGTSSSFAEGPGVQGVVGGFTPAPSFSTVTNPFAGTNTSIAPSQRYNDVTPGPEFYVQRQQERESAYPMTGVFPGETPMAKTPNPDEFIQFEQEMANTPEWLG